MPVAAPVEGGRRQHAFSLIWPGHVPPSSSSRFLTADRTRRWSTFCTALTVAILSSAVRSPLVRSCLRALSVPDRPRCSRFSRASRRDASSFLSSGIAIPREWTYQIPDRDMIGPGGTCRQIRFCPFIQLHDDAFFAAPWREFSIFTCDENNVSQAQSFGVPPPKFPGMAVTASVHTGQIACLSSLRVHVVPTCTRFFHPGKISRNPEKSFAESQLDALPCLRHPVIREFATSLRYQKAAYHG